MYLQPLEILHKNNYAKHQINMLGKLDILRRGSRILLGTIVWIWMLITLLQHTKSQTSGLKFIEIEDFLQTEADMISKIHSYLAQEREHLDQLKTTLFNWKEWRTSNTDQETQYIAIPQNLLKLFKRLTIDLDQITRRMLEDRNNGTGAINDIKPPTEDHLKRVVLSLVDLQLQHGLKAEDIMNGTMMNMSLNASLSLDACHFIGQTCSEYNNHQCAIDWLNTCYSLSSDAEFDYKIEKLIYPSYIFANQTSDALRHATHCLDYYYYDTATLHAYYELSSQLGELDDTTDFVLEAQRICREKPTNPITSTLKCRYNHENSAFLKIAPLKEEEIYHHPKVLLYRDIVYDSEIETIKAEVEGGKHMHVSQTIGTDGSDISKGFSFRISETAFIDNQQESFLPQLRQRMEDISDLSIKSSEWWQVLNYAPGGFYILHSDYLHENSSDVIEQGNRMSTMLFYFNDVPLGGETVFPRIGVSVKPTKGLGLVWSNVHPNGSENELLEHTACPVIKGEKWGFTQWMRSLNQKCIRKTYEYHPTILQENALRSLRNSIDERNATAKC
ncbi:prolyl 4-hydroxylase subunit alpha-2-like isoform X2 [Planococcus citri]|uniref:prolyl 4-hydroxylase subunit alpha-2-like isoform X2 n=1 Tax=Planococcus citri TaxID=170843 RepID=UPI0031F901EC